MKLSVDQALRQARRLAKSGDQAGAAQVYREILARFPGNRTAATELAELSTPSSAPDDAALEQLVALYNAQRWDEALRQADALIAAHKPNEILHNIAGAINVGAGRLNEAVAHYDRAIAIAADFFEAFNNKGSALLELRRPLDALAAFDAAIRLEPGYAEANLNRGIALGQLGRTEEALAAFGRGILLNPDRAEAYNNRGNLLLRQHRLRDALRDYERAIRLRPTYAEALLNRGNALKMLRRPEEAVASYDRAIAAAPGLYQAYANRGTALRQLKRPEAALESLGAALRLKPDHAIARAELLDLQAHLALWTGKASLPDAHDGAVPPFYVLHLADDPARQLACAQAWAEEKFGGIRPDVQERGAPGPKIRVGYFSADFHNHATMYLMARLFELHDRSQFEIHAFSYGADAQDEMRARLIGAVDDFHEVADLDDRQIAALSNLRGIDIAIDLKGYTEDGRPGIFAHRAAPVQAAYLGYPGTMGADFIDYIIADDVTIPAEARNFYSETIAALPHSYQVNDDQRRISEAPVSRVECGLPEDGFVFCCFNNGYKISPDAFAIWMRLLREVEGSVLWLLRADEIAVRNLRSEAERAGVDPGRLVFADRVPLDRHLARHRCADLFLDTFVYNAHTTASDALWAGLPVVTKLGKSFAARVGGSLLHALDLPELVTGTEADYEALALDLARNPARLAAIKAKLSAKRTTAPLFDAARFTRDIEALYARLCGRELANREANALAG